MANLNTFIKIGANTGNFVGSITGTTVSASGNVTGGNLRTSGTISATGNIIAGNVIGTIATANQSLITTVGTLTSVSSTGNVTGGNILSAGDVSATGNVYGDNISVTGNITTPTGAVYGVPASYAKYTRSAAQTGAVANTVIVCNVLENSFGSDISVNTSTGRVTLAAGKTYRLRASIVGWSSPTANRPTFGWYNETGSAWIGEVSENYNANDNAANGAMAGTAEAVFTANATTVVSFRVLPSASGTLSLGGNTDFNTTGSYPWIDIEVIGGQAPITDFTSISTTGNIVGGNVLTSGLVSATGNITSNAYIKGNSSRITKGFAMYASANTAVPNGQSQITSWSVSGTGSDTTGLTYNSGTWTNNTGDTLFVNLTLMGSWTPNATGSRFQWINAPTGFGRVGEAGQVNNGGEYVVQNSSAAFPMTNGQSFTVSVYQDSGNTINYGGSRATNLMITVG